MVGIVDILLCDDTKEKTVVRVKEEETVTLKRYGPVQLEHEKKLLTVGLSVLVTITANSRWFDVNDKML